MKYLFRVFFLCAVWGVVPSVHASSNEAYHKVDPLNALKTFSTLTQAIFEPTKQNAYTAAQGVAQMAFTASLKGSYKPQPIEYKFRALNPEKADEEKAKMVLSLLALGVFSADKPEMEAYIRTQYDGQTSNNGKHNKNCLWLIEYGKALKRNNVNKMRALKEEPNWAFLSHLDFSVYTTGYAGFPLNRLTAPKTFDQLAQTIAATLPLTNQPQDTAWKEAKAHLQTLLKDPELTSYQLRKRFTDLEENILKNSSFMWAASTLWPVVNANIPVYSQKAQEILNLLIKGDSNIAMNLEKDISKVRSYPELKALTAVQEQGDVFEAQCDRLKTLANTYDLQALETLKNLVDTTTEGQIWARLNNVDVTELEKEAKEAHRKFTALKGILPQVIATLEKAPNAVSYKNMITKFKQATVSTSLYLIVEDLLNKAYRDSDPVALEVLGKLALADEGTINSLLQIWQLGNDIKEKSWPQAQKIIRGKIARYESLERAKTALRDFLKNKPGYESINEDLRQGNASEAIEKLLQKAFQKDQTAFKVLNLFEKEKAGLGRINFILKGGLNNRVPQAFQGKSWSEVQDLLSQPAEKQLLSISEDEEEIRLSNEALAPYMKESVFSEWNEMIKSLKTASDRSSPAWNFKVAYDFMHYNPPEEFLLGALRRSLGHLAAIYVKNYDAPREEEAKKLRVFISQFLSPIYATYPQARWGIIRLFIAQMNYEYLLGDVYKTQLAPLVSNENNPKTFEAFISIINTVKASVLTSKS